jgi:superfamily II DNA/RNA helicase
VHQLNYDLPRVSADYIHRVGRTARAGRGGVALSLVSQYDVAVLQSIERGVGRALVELDAAASRVEPDGVHALVKSVTAAKQMAKMHLEEFDKHSRVVKKKKRVHGRDADGERVVPAAPAAAAAAASPSASSAAPASARSQRPASASSSSGARSFSSKSKVNAGSSAVGSGSARASAAAAAEGGGRGSHKKAAKKSKLAAGGLG